MTRSVTGGGAACSRGGIIGCGGIGRERGAAFIGAAGAFKVAVLAEEGGGGRGGGSCGGAKRDMGKEEKRSQLRN
jgi:hypothetical protein